MQLWMFYLRIFGNLTPEPTPGLKKRISREEKDFNVPPLPLTELAMLEPVSYTHLRAHETVLDLVCRLLLEKQKQNKKK